MGAVLPRVADTDRIVLALSGPLTPDGTARLCAALAARAAGGGALVEVRIDASVRADLAAVETLARLRLTARRLGCRTVVVGAGPELTDLLGTVGLGFLVAGTATGTEAGTGP